MRRMKTPLWRRANAQLNSAVRAPPTWKEPVGLGAKRTLTISDMEFHSTAMRNRGPRAEAAPTCHPCPRRRLEADSSHDGAGKETDGEHDPAPDGWGVHDRRAAVEGTKDDARDGVGLAREGGDAKARGHAGFHEAGPGADDADVTVAVGEAEPVEECGEAGFRGTVEVVAAPGAVPRHGAEGTDGAAAARGEALGGQLAEHGRGGEVDVEKPAQALRVPREDLRGGEVSGRHHQRVEPARRLIGLIEGGGECRGLGQVEVPGGDDPARAPGGQVAGRDHELRRIAPEEDHSVPALRKEAGDGAAHAARGTDHGRLHARSPSTRTDCAERNRRSGSHRSRTRHHSASRGIMRAKSSALVTASFARYTRPPAVITKALSSWTRASVCGPR